MSLRVVIVDDEPLARDGVALRLRDEPDVEVVAMCADGEEAVKAVHELAPDLVFLDVRMPGTDGVRCDSHHRRGSDARRHLPDRLRAARHRCVPCERRRLPAEAAGSREARRSAGPRPPRSRPAGAAPTHGRASLAAGTARHDEARDRAAGCSCARAATFMSSSPTTPRGWTLTATTSRCIQAANHTAARVAPGTWKSGCGARLPSHSPIHARQHQTHPHARRQRQRRLRHVLNDGTRLKVSRGYKDALFAALDRQN